MALMQRAAAVAALKGEQGARATRFYRNLHGNWAEHPMVRAFEAELDAFVAAVSSKAHGAPVPLYTLYARWWRRRRSKCPMCLCGLCLMASGAFSLPHSYCILSSL